VWTFFEALNVVHQLFYFIPKVNKRKTAQQLQTSLIQSTENAITKHTDTWSVRTYIVT
jgi:hypothetical protein